MRSTLFLLGLLLLASSALSISSLHPWLNPRATPSERAHALLARMTLNEKLGMVHGDGGPYAGVVNAIPRLEVPALHLEDGPQGVGDGVKLVTAWPSALTVVATWDRNLMYQYGVGMGKEQRIKGTNIMLGPMINIARVPMGGRNFESYGEDPFLASELVKPAIQGIQSQGVMACAKHFVDNNQENDRTTVSANVDERTQYEIYYPAFQAAVDAGVGAIMCSYNKINNTYACENEQTLNVDLKGRMEFKGFVLSDWAATHSTVKAANSGLDQQMPDATFFGTSLQQAVANGQVSQATIDDKVLRILTSMFAIGLFDQPQTGNISVDAQSAKHTSLARSLAEAGTVLLKNNKGALPIDAKNVRSIAVIGDDADLKPTAIGGGSGYVIPPYIVTPLQGIKSKVSNTVKVTYAPSASIQDAQAIAREAEVAIVFVAVESSEGYDRPNLALPGNQDALVSAVTSVQPNTIVVIHCAGAVLMPWASTASAIVAAFLPGQEDGNAIATILFGLESPSGKLPVTFPVTQSEIPVNTPSQYPGINLQADYSEKLLVGYRWYDAKNVAPLFPFGHGLSYTKFSYSNLKITGTSVSFDVQNSGIVAGAEVAQLYLGFPASAGEPPKSLKGFEKVFLVPGGSTTITITLTSRDFSIWDVSTHNWRRIPGVFNVFVGSSSRDIRLTGTINL